MRSSPSEPLTFGNANLAFPSDPPTVRRGGMGSGNRTDPSPARLRRRVTYRSAALGLIIVGTVYRLIALVLNWGSRLDADAQEYLLLAKRYSFGDPFSASYREPLWRAIVKVTTGPFGYSPDALRTFTTFVSIATLPVAWIFFRRLAARWSLHPRLPLIGFGLFALSQQVLRDAPRGLREDLCLLLFLAAAAPLLCADRSRRGTASIAVSIGVLSLIRWELGTLLVAVTLLFALARRVSPAAPVGAAVCLVALSGPWLLAHKERHGDFGYPSKVHATFYWKQEQSPTVVRRYLTAPGAEPRVVLSWKEYYLDHLGPAETLKRVVLGYPRLGAKLVASQIVPRSAAVSVLGPNQQGSGWLLSMLAVGIAIAVVGAAAGLRVWRRKRSEPLFVATLAMLLLAIVPYAALAAFVETRVLMFAAPLVAILVASVADACLPADVQIGRRVKRLAPTPAEGAA